MKGDWIFMVVRARFLIKNKPEAFTAISRWLSEERTTPPVSKAMIESTLKGWKKGVTASKSSTKFTRLPPLWGDLMDVIDLPVALVADGSRSHRLMADKPPA